MKINIITFFWSNNLGALVQAFSLKRFIENKFNISPKFNTYSPKKLINRERISQINKKNFNIIHKIFLKKIKLFYWKNKFLKCDFPDQKINDYNDDLYIYGSDEIWNNQNPFFGFDPYFFGKGNPKKKISYGVSIGTTNYENNKNIEQIKNYLAKFEKISVRDSSSQNFVKYCIGTNPPIVLDPCFLINIDTIIKKKIDYDFENDKYILIYGDYFNKQQIEDIKKISNKNKWKIISISFYNNWADKNFITADPVDLIYFIINSNLVFTSMFHGVMLSYKYKKQFWISEDPYRINKLSYFIDYFGLKNRYLDKGDIRNDLIDYKNYNNKFLDLLDKSKNFLKQNLN
tara:strand:+ start:6369 stop:7403 length:1035 start_codon:yes stop_codon:yes gene_type:complete